MLLTGVVKMISLPALFITGSVGAKIAADQIPQPSYGHSKTLRQKQDVVPVSIVHDQPAEPQDISQPYAIRSVNGEN